MDGFSAPEEDQAQHAKVSLVQKAKECVNGLAGSKAVELPVEGVTDGYQKSP